MATHRINHHSNDDTLDNVVEQHANKRLKKIQEEQAKAYERGHHHSGVPKFLMNLVVIIAVLLMIIMMFWK
ncbi:hypothetical protein HF864_08315 [Lactobacillus sp. MRS-253-APC-2B]|uniref:hypothetical protein n=1 Tax=Lactobacillus sp. MRS-253-APC-2B TaxID=2725305 RepID=UPI00146D9F6D|nr:hypothetical protein [Lactobacillus sp. MRS-253-APC-2B]NME34756.1 hypothetical protein [Lactobacillus sp. MRS-253-APC-2B]